jgi:uncharacterized protein (DUF1330 family)
VVSVRRTKIEMHIFAVLRQPVRPSHHPSFDISFAGSSTHRQNGIRTETNFWEKAMVRSVEIDHDAARVVGSIALGHEPVVMINLLRFRAQADYGHRSDEFAPCSGREAYFERYASVSSPLVMADGAKIHWMGEVLGNVIAPPGENWDDILLVEYPSFDVLLKLFANPEYLAVVIHRTAALEDSRLIASVSSKFAI